MNVDRTILDASEILDSFDLNDIFSLISEQIPVSYEENMYTADMADYFRPLYKEFTRLMQDSVTEEIKTEVSNRFTKICCRYVERICERYKLSFSDEWLDDNIHRLPAATAALYSFFVLDFKNTLAEALLKYINQHRDQISDVFKNAYTKKDSSTLTNKKLIPDEYMAMVASNIFNITMWITTNMEEEEFLELVSDGYIAGLAVKKFFEEGVLSGELMDTIAEIYTTDITLRSDIGFTLICNIRDRYKQIKTEDNEEV